MRDAAAAEASPFLERNAWPEHWETKLPFLGNAERTANDAFFVRSHFPVPEPAAASWKLEITGLVRNPLTLDLAALRAVIPTSRRATLECAGNGRGLFALPTTSGTQWGRGAVGTAEWRGPALASLLDRATSGRKRATSGSRRATTRPCRRRRRSCGACRSSSHASAAWSPSR
jgi:DMSO/TMAO reductase YedYZ molybdopterin-dependent catalytic subunit